CLLTITEGKFHQVKRMFRSVNNEVIYLKRLSIGSLHLDENLKPGDYRPLTQTEINTLQTSIF
ncbi:MAG: rRNA pseudouridine synthase, partial [Treponema sp.]|nr:rRNA pseudouridine synthase [Treponema sp.]